jgi:hypothetical protein
MSAKNLGQVAALVVSATAPSNQYVLWFNLTSNLLMSYNFVSENWESIGDASSLGQVKLSSSDTLNYLVNKIDTTLQVSGGKLGVSVPVTTNQISRWGSLEKVVFLATTAALSSYSGMITGDLAIISNDGSGNIVGYLYNGTTWVVQWTTASINSEISSLSSSLTALSVEVSNIGSANIPIASDGNNLNGEIIVTGSFQTINLSGFVGPNRLALLNIIMNTNSSGGTLQGVSLRTTGRTNVISMLNPILGSCTYTVMVQCFVNGSCDLDIGFNAGVTVEVLKVIGQI